MYHLLQIVFVTMVLDAADAAGGGQGQRELRYVIQEELEVDSSIADIKDDAGLARRYDAETLAALRFRFLAQPPWHIAIDETSGLIRTDGRIDREEICGDGGGDDGGGVGDGGCKIRLDVAVQPMIYFQIVKISVEILDVNDNSPRFEPDHRRHELSESATPGSAGFAVPSAHDADTRPYAVERYELRADPTRPADIDLFELTAHRKLDGSTDVRLVLVRPLDRERDELHRVIVVALDGGSPPRSGTLQVDVVVTDANDNSPEFEYSSYEVQIVENIPRGTTIARVRATDRDAGANAEVVYYLSAATRAAHGDVFSIDAASGAVVVIGAVDYESAPVYRLMLSARDRGVDPVSADAMVIVSVEDANDNAPRVTVNTLLASDTDLATVPENADAETFVAHVLVRDPDRGRNGRFDCALVAASGGEDEDFRLKGIFADGEYQIVTRRRFDREQRGRYDVQLACRDGGSPPLVGFGRLTVEVADLNDNEPVFERDMYEVEVRNGCLHVGRPTSVYRLTKFDYYMNYQTIICVDCIAFCI